MKRELKKTPRHERRAVELYAGETTTSAPADNTRTSGVNNLHQSGGSQGMDRTHADSVYKVAVATAAGAATGAAAGVGGGAAGVILNAARGAAAGFTIATTSECGSCHRTGRSND
jgi:hypothetical protein